MPPTFDQRQPLSPNYNTQDGSKMPAKGFVASPVTSSQSRSRSKSKSKSRQRAHISPIPEVPTMNSTATHTSTRSMHLAQLTAALQKQVKLLKKENIQLKKQMDHRGAAAHEASSSGVVAKQICDNFSQSHMPTGSERPAESTRDINDLKVTVMIQVEKIKQLEEVLEELKCR